MRCRIFLVALTMFVLRLGHAHAQTSADYFRMRDFPLVETSETEIDFLSDYFRMGDFPLVETSETEIGFLQSLIGSAQIFLTPNTFGDYWPDYGYSWTDVRDGSACGSLSAVQRQSKVGTVALVMPKAQQSSEYIGLDLTNRISLEAIENRGLSDPITLQRLCAWLRHQNPAQIESYVRRASNLRSMEGLWTPADINLNEEYRFIGIGEVVREAAPDSIGWNLPDGSLLDWKIPQSVDLQPVDLEDDERARSRPLYRVMPTQWWNRGGQGGSEVFSIWRERDMTYIEKSNGWQWDRSHFSDWNVLRDETIYRLVPSEEAVKPYEIESAWVALKTLDGVVFLQPIEPRDEEPEPVDMAESRSGWTWSYDGADDDGPIYYLMPISGSINPNGLQQFNVSVDDHGTLSIDDFAAEEGTEFALWAADREQSGGNDWWLITEHTLRSPEFRVGIRVTDYR